ncbi:MAG: hypothetical protein QXR89_00960 [Candidatus Bathyarchaeia archaeon]
MKCFVLGLCPVDNNRRILTFRGGNKTFLKTLAKEYKAIEV